MPPPTSPVKLKLSLESIQRKPRRLTEGGPSNRDLELRPHSLSHSPCSKRRKPVEDEGTGGNRWVNNAVPVLHSSANGACLEAPALATPTPDLPKRSPRIEKIEVTPTKRPHNHSQKKQRRLSCDEPRKLTEGPPVLLVPRLPLRSPSSPSLQAETDTGGSPDTDLTDKESTRKTPPAYVTTVSAHVREAAVAAPPSPPSSPPSEDADQAAVSAVLRTIECAPPYSPTLPRSSSPSVISISPAESPLLLVHPSPIPPTPPLPPLHAKEKQPVQAAAGAASLNEYQTARSSAPNLSMVPPELIKSVTGGSNTVPSLSQEISTCSTAPLLDDAPSSVLLPSPSSTDPRVLSEFRDRFLIATSDDETVIAHFLCALYQRILLQGKLYVTSKRRITFYSTFNDATLFGIPTIVTFSLKDVIAIRKRNNALIFPNSIEFEVRESDNALLLDENGNPAQAGGDRENNEGAPLEREASFSASETKGATTATHFFTSFIGRDKAFDLIYKIWKEEEGESARREESPRKRVLEETASLVQSGVAAVTENIESFPIPEKIEPLKEGSENYEYWSRWIPKDGVPFPKYRENNNGCVVEGNAEFDLGTSKATDSIKWTNCDMGTVFRILFSNQSDFFTHYLGASQSFDVISTPWSHPVPFDAAPSPTPTAPSSSSSLDTFESNLLVHKEDESNEEVEKGMEVDWSQRPSRRWIHKRRIVRDAFAIFFNLPNHADVVETWTLFVVSPTQLTIESRADSTGAPYCDYFSIISRYRLTRIEEAEEPCSTQLDVDTEVIWFKKTIFRSKIEVEAIKKSGAATRCLFRMATQALQNRAEESSPGFIEESKVTAASPWRGTESATTEGKPRMTFKLPSIPPWLYFTLLTALVVCLTMLAYSSIQAKFIQLDRRLNELNEALNALSAYMRTTQDSSFVSPA